MAAGLIEKGRGESLDKEILVQYCELKEEIKDIRRRKEKLEQDIRNLKLVSDSVKGTRPDGTYGSIKITGYPRPAYFRKQLAIEKYQKQLELKEVELMETMTQVEEYIESIKKSELRTMFRLYYIDGLPWWKVAKHMNKMFPKRSKKFTEDSCKKRNLRFFENVPHCPEEKC